MMTLDAAVRQLEDAAMRFAALNKVRAPEDPQLQRARQMLLDARRDVAGLLPDDPEAPNTCAICDVPVGTCEHHPHAEAEG